MQYISRQPSFPLLSYATCVRVTPTLGYIALIATHCNFFMAYSCVARSSAPMDVGIDRSPYDDATTVYPCVTSPTFVTLVRGSRASEVKLTNSGNTISHRGYFII